MTRNFIPLLFAIALISAAIFPATPSATADDSTQPSTQPSTASSDFRQVDADALRQDYIDNEVRADADYGHGSLDVTGVVRTVKLVDGNPLIALGGQGNQIAVACTFLNPQGDTLDQIKALNPGDRVTICVSVKDVVSISTGQTIRVQGIFFEPPAKQK